MQEIAAKCDEADYDGHTGAQTLLLVDDEDFVLDLESQILESRGYKVLRAQSAEKALAVIAEQGDQIALLITDVKMPAMSGIELAEKLSQVCPGMKMLFISAFPGSDEFDNDVADGEKHFLQKPFSPEALLTKVQSVLKS